MNSYYHSVQLIQESRNLNQTNPYINFVWNIPGFHIPNLYNNLFTESYSTPATRETIHRRKFSYVDRYRHEKRLMELLIASDRCIEQWQDCSYRIAWSHLRIPRRFFLKPVSWPRTWACILRQSCLRVSASHWPLSPFSRVVRGIASSNDHDAQSERRSTVDHLSRARSLSRDNFSDN